MKLESELTTNCNLIISSEMLEKVPLRGNKRSLDTFLGRLVSWGFKISAIYTLRRQDVIVDSIFKQWVASYDTRFCGDPIQMACDEIPQLFYSQFAESWRNHPLIESVFLIPFIESNFTETARRFLDVIRMPTAPSSNLELNQSNKSLDGSYLRLKHLINSRNFSRTFNENFVDIIVNSDLLKTEPKLTILTKDKQADYLSNFREDNACLESQFHFDTSSWSVMRTQNTETFISMNEHDIEATLYKIQHISPNLSREIRNLLKNDYR